MPAGRVHEPPDDRQKLVKLINSRDTAIGRRAACFVDRLDLGICSVDERRIGVGGLISLLALCVGVLCCRGVVFGVLCFSPLSRGVSRAPKTSFHKLPEVGEYSYREKFVARWRERWGERWRERWGERWREHEGRVIRPAPCMLCMHAAARTNKPKSRASRMRVRPNRNPHIIRKPITYSPQYYS